jgi:uncharacterized protein (TIGR01370 family)
MPTIATKTTPTILPTLTVQPTVSMGVQLDTPTPPFTLTHIPSLRERIKAVKDYVVYYGTGRVHDLARYDLAIVQPDTLTPSEVADLHADGTLVVAYLSVGEVEPDRPWFKDGRVDQTWLLGKNEDWGSYFVDARQTGWQKLTAALAGEFIAKGYDGVFLDTVDTASAFPDTKPGMVALIHNLRQTYSDVLLVQNRGFDVVNETAPDIDAVMFEDLSTTYDFQKNTYVETEVSAEAEFMADVKQRTGLMILALDYAPPDAPDIAHRAVGIARQYGFIPSVSVINLDDIPDYGFDLGSP